MPFEFQRRVEFRDTDAAGIAHFSAFFPMMEAAEHALLRSIGISVLAHEIDEGAPISWPRVSASCEYLAPARFEDELTISVRVAKIGESSVHYAADIRRADTPIASGKIVAVCCRVADKGLEKTKIPESVRDLLAQFQ